MQPQTVSAQTLPPRFDTSVKSNYDGDLFALTSEALSSMDLAVLARRCVIESERFYRRQPYEPQLPYELFRRAIVDQNQHAWRHIYQIYASQVDRWVRREPAFVNTDESGEYFVNAAFFRFSHAVTAAKFAKFSTLAALLHYLQHCARCVVIDTVRAYTFVESLPEDETHPIYIAQISPDEEAIEHISNTELWRYVETLLHSDTEYTVLYLSFVVGMKPKTIYTSYPTLFHSVQEVYAIKRNVLERLSRDCELRKQFA